jgi:hypothetical protein
MSWLSIFLRKNKASVLTDLLAALLDGKISQKELQAILVKVGLGVVDAGMPGQLQKAYDWTDPVKLANLGGKTLNEMLAEVNKAHVLLGTLLKEVK